MESNSKWTKEQRETFQKSWAKIVAKAWSDSAFREQLLKNPKAVLKEQGIELPEEIDCKITENTDKIVYFNLPKKPEGNLSETQLREVVGGSSGNCDKGGAPCW